MHRVFFVAFVVATCNAFVPPAASHLSLRTPAAAAVRMPVETATMIFGSKKPAPKAAKKVVKKAKKVVKKAAPGKAPFGKAAVVQQKTSLKGTNIGYQNKLPFPLGQVVDAFEVLRNLPK